MIEQVTHFSNLKLDVFVEFRNIFVFIHRLAKAMSTIMEEFLFFLLLGCSSILALDLFVLDSQNMLSMETIVAAYDIISVLAMAYLFCCLSDKLTLILLKMGDVYYYNSAWYAWPMKQRHCLILLIQRAQNDFHLTSFGFKICSLLVFQKVILMC